MRRFTPRWINRTIVGIVAATFFSDAGHEISTAVLPLYLTAIGLGPQALALVEGVADFVVSLSRLAGGLLGHWVRHKRPWASLGYLITCSASGALGLVTSVHGLVALRSLAWAGRGYRGPLRDSLLSDAVEKTHYGRVFGLERAGDMLGAVSGPLMAAGLLAAGLEFRSILLLAFFPGLIAASSMFFLTQERQTLAAPTEVTPRTNGRSHFSRSFWSFLIGVLLFGLGDFSRSFLIWLCAQALGEHAPAHHAGQTGGVISVAVLLYAAHNATSALAAYPIGALGDRLSKRRVLVYGYALGVVTNMLLTVFSHSLPGLIVVILLSGLYISVEETLEKAVLAELLAPQVRSLGFGILACTNAVGDLVSSLSVGYFLSVGSPAWAFGTASAMSAAGVAWLAWFTARR